LSVAKHEKRRTTVTYQPDCTLPTELPEQIAKQVLAVLLELIAKVAVMGVLPV
jgi:hypothetical protein